MSNIRNIRNFTIIAHVDHGKSTLADAILNICGVLGKRDSKKNPSLDTMELEQEKGITIKAQTCRLNFPYQNNIYQLNLIDTPGHIDFSYEVSRSLAACEISILLIDATKGVEAQTISNLWKAIDADHFIIPVLNKVDLNTANIDKCFDEIAELGLDISIVHQISAKTGQGVKELLEFIVQHAPGPKGNEAELRALVIDSWYNKYLGVVTLVRIMDGMVKAGLSIKAHYNNKTFNILNVGVFEPEAKKIDCLYAGEIGYIVTQIKNPTEMNIGDTLVLENNSNYIPLPGFKKSKPVVFCTFYPNEPELANQVHESLKKYILNDSAFSFEVENSDIYGMVFVCGFLGLLHLEIVKERLLREYDVDVLPTLPNVVYRITMKDHSQLSVYNPNLLPPKEKIEIMEEPEVLCTIYTQNHLIGKISNLCINKRAEELRISSEKDKTIITCKIPLSEIIVDFADNLQSISSGFASFEYLDNGYRISNLTKLIILINDDMIKEFSLIVHESKARAVGKHIVEKLKEIIPRSQVDIKIQVALNTNSPSNIVARSDIKAYKKNVIAKCYGGDITRKKKLLEAQKQGKKDMNNRSRNFILKQIPSNAVKTLLKMDINH